MLIGEVFNIVPAVYWSLVSLVDDIRTFGYSVFEVSDEGHVDFGEENRENEGIHDRNEIKSVLIILGHIGEYDINEVLESKELANEDHPVEVHHFVEE